MRLRLGKDLQGVIRGLI